MTAGFWSPLPPQRTGVADYSAALLEHLGTHMKVALAAEKADVHLYHLGNNGLHAAIYRRALERPGVVVLHDAVLHHLLLGALTEQEYADEFVYNYGEWERAHAVELWRRRARSGADAEYFRFPLIRRVAERSLVIVVHNPAAAEIVRTHAPAARVHEIPHLWVPADARRSPSPGDVRFGLLGYLRETKRVFTVLEAFAHVSPAFPAARLFVAGSAPTELARAMKPYLAHPKIVRLPWHNDREFDDLIASLHVCINLRYPGAGETSGIAIRAMGAGCCVMLSDTAENARFPETACIRVDTGVNEAAMLEQCMAAACHSPAAVRACGTEARQWIESHHHVDRVAAQYAEVLREAAA